ncbi:MAG: hypothetical protein K2O32_10520 [Acetatifactor sp.]|nr:hypothetical protein [Acetatifactor sp.]
MKKLSIILMTVAMTVLMTGCGKTINANDYVTVEVSGYDGYGTAKVVFDEDKFEKACEKLSFKDKTDEAKLVSLLYGSVDTFLMDCMDGKFTVEGDGENGKLSNGDVVVYKWDLDEENAKEIAGVTLKASDISTKVKGLEQVATFDAFAVVELSFSGVAPNGQASLKNLAVDGNMTKLAFSMDKYNGLSNGDTITVTLNSSNNTSYMIETFGGVPETDTKEYTVSGLDAYATKLDDISEDMYSKMDQQARDTISAYVANNWNNPSDLHGVELLGNYFLAPKSADVYGNKNSIDFIYKLTAVDSETGEDFDFYWYTNFHDVMVLADGTVSVNLTDTKIPNVGGWFSTGESFKRSGLTYAGYEDLDTLFNNRVSQNVANYSYENTVK